MHFVDLCVCVCVCVCEGYIPIYGTNWLLDRYLWQIGS